MRHGSAVLLLGVQGLVAVAASGCASSGLRFSGVTQKPWTIPSHVSLVDRPPPAHTRLGSVTADCTPLADGEPLVEVRLSDLSCSRQLLVAALKDRAAAAGGNFLVGAACDEGTVSDRLSCRGEVWAPEEGDRLAPMAIELAVNVDPLGPAAPGAPPLGSVDDAWEVAVNFAPLGADSAVVSIGPAEIAEFDFPRVGFRRLGDARARCEGECSELSLRNALTAVAAHVGGASLVGVRCVRLEALECVAGVTAPEQDERRLAGMR